MNIFTTDHPMVREPSRFQRLAFRWCVAIVLSYSLYLLGLGPFYALDGHGLLDFAPSRIRNWCFYPAWPVYQFVGTRHLYHDYLTGWSNDPNAPDRETGW